MTLSHDFLERLMYALKNETDGFMATVLEPSGIGLPVYVICNCYGIDRGRFLIPKKHRKMIVEIAKDDNSNRRCKRFDWRKTIPIEVSESPKILLTGKRLRWALSVFTKQELEPIYNFVSRHRRAIERHWLGESDSEELIRELEASNHSGTR